MKLSVLYGTEADKSIRKQVPLDMAWIPLNCKRRANGRDK